jgi:uncharacterized membrane protein required for colicin V production
MIPAWLSIFNAILAALLVEVGVVGAHMGTIPPMSGFLAFLLSFVVAILALLFGLISLARSSIPERRPERPKAVAGIVLGLLIAVPVGSTMWRWLSMPYPNIQRHHNRLR